MGCVCGRKPKNKTTSEISFANQKSQKSLKECSQTHPAFFRFFFHFFGHFGRRDEKKIEKRRTSTKIGFDHCVLHHFCVLSPNPRPVWPNNGQKPPKNPKKTKEGALSQKSLQQNKQ